MVDQHSRLPYLRNPERQVRGKPESPRSERRFGPAAARVSLPRQFIHDPEAIPEEAIASWDDTASLWGTNTFQLAQIREALRQVSPESTGFHFESLVSEILWSCQLLMVFCQFLRQTPTTGVSSFFFFE